MSKTAPSPVRVVQLGPPADALGGMASVVEQINGLSLGPRFETVSFSATSAPSGGERLPAKLFRHVSAMIRLARLVHRERCAIVHVHTCSGFSFYRSLLDALVARLLMRRVVLHVHGGMFGDFFHGSSRFGRFIIRHGLRCADAVVALSESWRMVLERMSPGARVAVIENAVRLPELKRDEATDPACDASARMCRFLLLARMDAWKGVDDLFEACARLHREAVPFELTLAGPSGTAGDAVSLNERIEHLGLSKCVRYVGEVRGRAKEKQFRGSDVYVQPSHSEGMPISVLEAFSYALPVIATDVGAMGEVITGGREGLIVSRHAPDELADAMGRLARDPKSRRAMGSAALQLMRRRFSESRLRDDLVLLYEKLQPDLSGSESGACCGPPSTIRAHGV